MKSSFRAVFVTLVGSVALSASVASRTSYAQGEAGRIHLCGQGTTEYSPASGERCPEGRTIRRSLKLPRSVYSEKVHYETWGLGLHILLTDEGLRFFPRPRDLPRYTEHTDTIFLHPGGAKSFEQRLGQHAEIFSGRRMEELAWDDEADPDFRVLSLARERDKDNPYPALLYVPKAGQRIFFICAVPFMILRDGAPNDPRCAVRDFTDPSNDEMDYNLRRSALHNWHQYSKWLWDYVNSASK